MAKPRTRRQGEGIDLIQDGQRRHIPDAVGGLIVLAVLATLVVGLIALATYGGEVGAIVAQIVAFALGLAGLFGMLQAIADG